jgi:hypothetical protein
MDWSDPDNVIRRGWETPNGTKLIQDSNDVVVIKVPGRTYNPGSRNSMLKSYAPAEFEVYAVPERGSPTSGWAYPLTAFKVRS